MFVGATIGRSYGVFFLESDFFAELLRLKLDLDKLIILKVGLDGEHVVGNVPFGVAARNVGHTLDGLAAKSNLRAYHALVDSYRRVDILAVEKVKRYVIILLVSGEVNALGCVQPYSVFTNEVVDDSGEQLRAVDVSGWDTANCESFLQLFDGCRWLKSVDVSRWNTANVRDYRGMFHGGQLLQTPDLSGWSRHPNALCQLMFDGCPRVKTDDWK